MMFLIRLDQAASDSTHVVDDIHVSSSLALLATMAAKSNGLSNVRVFVGYAGWAAGQLDVEILRGRLACHDGGCFHGVRRGPRRHLASLDRAGRRDELPRIA